MVRCHIFSIRSNARRDVRTRCHVYPLQNLNKVREQVYLFFPKLLAVWTSPLPNIKVTTRSVSEKITPKLGTRQQKVPFVEQTVIFGK